MDNIELSVSIDGNRETNDLKRHHYNGSSSYDETIATLEFLKEHKTNVRVRMTVNKETIKDFANNFIELRRRQYGIVAYAINMDDFWDADDIREYGRQLNLIMDYYIAEDPEESKYFYTILKRQHLEHEHYVMEEQQIFIFPQRETYIHVFFLLVIKNLNWEI